MSTDSEFRFATCPLMSDGAMLSWKVIEPSILQAHLNAAAFMRVIGGAWSLGGVSAGLDLVVVCVLTVGDVVRSICLEVQKVILPNTQSISGLWWVSQLCPRTIKQEGSREVT